MPIPLPMPRAERQLRIVAGNRLEDLASALAEQLQAAPLPPFATDTIIVQSPGMRRWVTLAMARRLGCAASVVTPFPSGFCVELATALASQVTNPLQGDGRGNRFSNEALRWCIFARLGLPLVGAVYAPLITYLRDDDHVRRWQLAQRIADRFDEYQLYRGADLLAWDLAGSQLNGHAGWQAVLWRELGAGSPQPHLARHLNTAIRLLESTTTAPTGLPPRITAFAVGSLPPVFLELLHAVARHRPVTVYVVSPTPHFWDDLRSPRDQAREQRRARRPAVTAETGNPLLAGFGRQGRELFSLLQQHDDTGQAWEDLTYHDPGTDNALHTLQHDVLHLLDRGHDGTPVIPLRADDASLTIHSCHSPVRELEIVRDHLYAAFVADPTLTPDQVLVLVTDLARYAPFVATVLGARRAGVALPIRLADRGRDAEEPAARGVLAILRLSNARLTAPEVCDLLELDPLRAAAGIERDELSTLRQWIVVTGIRWGADSHTRTNHDLPAFAGNSWRDGLDRLVAGAATGSVDRLVAGLAPWSGDTASSADLIGRFVRWFDVLAATLADLHQPRPLREWAVTVPRMIDALLGDDENTVNLRTRIATLLSNAAPHAGEAPIELAVVRDVLTTELADDAQAGAFLWGGITVAALKPLRTIPARVIAVCGLDDGIFPRRVTPSAFDIIAAHPQLGDRRVRDEDRQLLLDTLLAASDRLILTYVGRSPIDDAALPPSVCVAELLDWCETAFSTSTGHSVREQLVVAHPLHPFSARYLDGADPRLFTYTPSVEHVQPHPVLLTTPLPAPIGELTIDWGDLAEAWTNPSRHFCQRALDLRLDSASDGLKEHEPIALNSLDSFKLRTWLAERLCHGATAASLQPIAIAQGLLPIGGLGEAAFAAAFAEAALVVERVGTAKALPPLMLDLRHAHCHLSGVLDRRTDNGLLHWRAGKVREQDQITLWIAHLAAQIADRPQSSRLVGLDRSLSFSPVSEAADILADLAAGYRDMLTRPLPVFLRASHAYYLQAISTKGKLDPLVKAKQAWAGSSFKRGPDCDLEDPYIARCWNTVDPFTDHHQEFISLAHRLWEPLLNALERG